MQDNILVYADQGDWQEPNPVDGELSRIVWGADTTDGYDTKVDIYYGTGEVLGLQILLTFDTDLQQAKGILIWDLGIAGDSSGAKIRVDFDGTSSPKTLDVEVIGMASDTIDDEPQRAVINMTVSDDHIFTLSGAYHIENPTDFTTTDPVVYNFTAIGYDEEIGDSTKNNKGILNLAVPLATLGDTTTMFADSSVGTIYGEVVLDAIRTDWDADTVTVANIEAWTSDALTFPSYAGTDPASDLSDEEIYQVLNWAATTGGLTELNDLIYITNLVNSAYFDTSGFVGTWDGAKGTLTGVPAGFEGLNIDSITPIIPDDVRTLTIPFLTTIPID